MKYYVYHVHSQLIRNGDIGNSDFILHSEDRIDTGVRYERMKQKLWDDYFSADMKIRFQTVKNLTITSLSFLHEVNE